MRLTSGSSSAVAAPTQSLKFWREIGAPQCASIFS
jgi:hypothetical protein